MPPIVNTDETLEEAEARSAVRRSRPLALLQPDPSHRREGGRRGWREPREVVQIRQPRVGKV